MFNFKSQIVNNQDNTNYHIQIETDNYEQYCLIQNIAKECINGECDKKEYKYNMPALNDLVLRDYNKPIEPNKNPLVFDMNNTYNPCITCPNNTINGGSGICNCTLSMQFTNNSSVTNTIEE